MKAFLLCDMPVGSCTAPVHQALALGRLVGVFSMVYGAGLLFRGLFV